jgi:hypothetical protein
MYKDTLCSNQIIFILLKSSQTVCIESEIAFLIWDYNLKIIVKQKAEIKISSLIVPQGNLKKISKHFVL